MDFKSACNAYDTGYTIYCTINYLFGLKHHCEIFVLFFLNLLVIFIITIWLRIDQVPVVRVCVYVYTVFLAAFYDSGKQVILKTTVYCGNRCAEQYKQINVATLEQ